MSGTLTAGDQVFDFVLPGTDGRTFDSHTARSQGLLMFVFWKKGCGTCRYSLPFLQRFHDLYARDGSFQIRGISQDSAEDTREFMRGSSLTFPQAIDENLEASEAYGLVTVPGVYLVNSGDRILRHAHAFVTDELNAMAKMIAEKQGREYIPVVRPEDDAPDIKPG